MNDESDSPLFEPVVILPSQICVDAPWVSATSGPIALMLAVLEEAARCIERGRRRRHPATRTLAAEAEAWVRCDSREWPFAFASICDVLGLDVDAARARFLADARRTDRRQAYTGSGTLRAGRDEHRSALPALRRGPRDDRPLVRSFVAVRRPAAPRGCAQLWFRVGVQRRPLVAARIRRASAIATTVVRSPSTSS